MGRDLLDVIHRYENYVSIFPIHRSITVATLKLETDYRCINARKLILKKIIKIVATRCQILRPKCTKCDFGWGSAPDPPQTPLGRLQRSPDPLAGFKGTYL